MIHPCSPMPRAEVVIACLVLFKTALKPLHQLALHLISISLQNTRFLSLPSLFRLLSVRRAHSLPSRTAGSAHPPWDGWCAQIIFARLGWRKHTPTRQAFTEPTPTPKSSAKKLSTAAYPLLTRYMAIHGMLFHALPHSMALIACLYPKE